MTIYVHHLGKVLSDFTMRDIRKLTFKSLNLCCKFYKMHEKLKGRGVREKKACSVEAIGASNFLNIKMFYKRSLSRKVSRIL